jgi:hypothetical protein
MISNYIAASKRYLTRVHKEHKGKSILAKFLQPRISRDREDVGEQYFVTRSMGT